MIQKELALTTSAFYSIHPFCRCTVIAWHIFGVISGHVPNSPAELIKPKPFDTQVIGVIRSTAFIHVTYTSFATTAKKQTLNLKSMVKTEIRRHFTKPYATISPKLLI